MTSRNPDQAYEAMGQAFQFFEEQLCKKIHTAIPAIIVSYDPATRRAQVRPAVDLLLTDGSTMPRALISDVPVLMPAAGGWAMVLPLAAGDTVLLLFCERDISGFKQDRDASRLPSNRVMSEADAVAVAGFGSSMPVLAASPSGVTIQNIDGTTAVIVEEGRITLRADTVNIEHSGGTQTWP